MPLNNHEFTISIALVPGSREEVLKKAEYVILLETLQHTNWNQKAAAELLGISTRVLCYKIMTHELRPLVSEKKKQKPKEGGSVETRTDR